MDFKSHSPHNHNECKELARQLLETIPEVSPKTVNWTKVQQCKERSDKSIQTIVGNWKEKTCKQYSGLTPLTTKMMLCLIPPLKKTQIRIWLLLVKKKIQVGLSYTQNALVILADQLFKTIKRKKGGIYEKYEPSIAPIKYTMPVEG